MVSKPFGGPSRFPDDENGDGPSNVGLFAIQPPVWMMILCNLYDRWLRPLEGHTAMDHKLLNVCYSE